MALHVESGYQVSAAESPIWGLPSDATRVSYYLNTGGPSNAYEFDTSEDSYRAWAKENRWPIQAIEKPVTITRYRHAQEGEPRHEFKEIAQGYSYFHQIEDRITSTAYDSSTGRAYVYTTSR